MLAVPSRLLKSLRNFEFRDSTSSLAFAKNLSNLARISATASKGFETSVFETSEKHIYLKLGLSCFSGH